MATDYMVRLLEPEEFNQWDTMVGESPQGSIFSKTFWFAAISSTFNLGYKLYGCYKGPSLAGGVGVFYTKRWGKTMAFSPKLTPYTGMLTKDFSSKKGKELVHNLEITEELIKVLEREYNYLHLVHHWGYKDVRPFTWAGWDSVVHYTFTIPLSNPEGLMDGFDYQVRKQINKGNRQNLVCYNSDDFEKFYYLLEMTYAKQNLLVPVARGQFLSLSKFLKDHCRLYFVKDQEGRVLAGRIILTDSTGAQDWVAGAEPAFLGTGATPYLLWHILQDLGRDYACLDLNGANIRTIARFKQNFGGALTPYYSTKKINSRLLKIGKTLKGLR